jgi:hypothetical protein
VEDVRVDGIAVVNPSHCAMTWGYPSQLIDPRHAEAIGNHTEALRPRTSFPAAAAPVRRSANAFEHALGIGPRS